MVKFVICIWKGLGWSFGWDACCSDRFFVIFLISSRQVSEQYVKFGHGQFHVV
jgi:hypothetical protein